ncbi:MAG: hypothetical protein O3A06_03640 [Proteobacteria bacterium]|nr:hypothetical protein [Pseudomonadota bacterium]
MSSPELTAWYRHYIEQKWIFTAFKIDGSEASRRLARGKAVRMSFKTERPFFPYREPESGRRDDGGKRLLPIHLLAEARYEGEIGRGGA